MLRRVEIAVLLVAVMGCRAETDSKSAPESASKKASKSAAVRVLDAHATLPAGLKLKGKLLDAVRFADTGGEYLLAVSEFRTGRPGDDLVSELHAQQWRKRGAAYDKVWKLWDFASNPLEWMDYSPSQFKVLDVDGDGLADTQLWYLKACDGLDPDTLKLMLYMQGKKLAIRGLIPKHADDLDRYEKNDDPALAQAPQAVRDHLAKEWEALVKDDLDKLKKEASEE